MAAKRTPWSRDEVELVVADYFAMLRAELSGKPVNKAERNRRLRAKLDGRSKGSVEFKHANITAALLQLGDFPTIDGYKPRSRYQRLLEEVILERIEIEPDFFERLASSPVVRPETAAPTDFTRLDALLEDAPEPLGEPGIHLNAPPASPGARVRKGVDFVKLDADNRRLGRLGEEWALEYERRRLHDALRRPDLGRRIVWVSDAEGDGAGYDIRSFNRDETHRLIEVKTTGLGKYHSFYVSPNEVGVSKREADRYHLYRVFSFATAPRLYMLRGALADVCRLEPWGFRARVSR
jgi:hypothetical protein